jgi:hypothetical protein
MQRCIYVFLDGVGLAEAASHNPFTPYNPTETLESGSDIQPAPFLATLLGGPLLAGLEVQTPQLLFKAIDAQLGVPGRPQSSTGQTSLYTGRNAQQVLGRHLTGFTNGSLRTLLEESGIFKQVLALGGTVTLANVYHPAYFEAVEQSQGRLRYAVGTLLALTAGIPFRMPTDLERGEALFWDITNEHLGQRNIEAPVITPAEAGRRLAQLGTQHNLTLFECFLPDYAGHDQDLEQARSVISILDSFFEGLFASVEPDITVVVCSDHGNIEDLSQKIHTFNPVPLLVKGPGAVAFVDITNIAQLTPTIVNLLQS